MYLRQDGCYVSGIEKAELSGLSTSLMIARVLKKCEESFRAYLKVVAGLWVDEKIWNMLILKALWIVQAYFSGWQLVFDT